MPKPIGFVAFFFMTLCTSARAQSGWEFGATGGGGPTFETPTLGGLSGRQLYVTTVFARHTLVHWKRFDVSYVGTVLPLVVATGVEKDRSPAWFYTDSHTDSVRVFVPGGKGPDAGAGIAPVGVQLAVQLTRKASFFVEGAGGGVAFTRAMPEHFARSLNFLGSAGAGIRLGKRDHRGFVFGYRMTHLSNANTAENPGFNAHVFFVGMTLH